MAIPPPCPWEKFLLHLHKMLLLGLFLVYYFALIPGSLYPSSPLISVTYNIASPSEGLGLAKGFVGLLVFMLRDEFTFVSRSLVISSTEIFKWFVLSHVANWGQNEPRYPRNEQERKKANQTSDVFCPLVSYQHKTVCF